MSRGQRYSDRKPRTSSASGKASVMASMSGSNESVMSVASPVGPCRGRFALAALDGVSIAGVHPDDDDQHRDERPPLPGDCCPGDPATEGHGIAEDNPMHEAV